MRQAIAQGQGSSTPTVVNSGIASGSFVDGGNPGEISYDSSGNKYVWDGTSWIQTSTNGTAHVADGFKPSSYTGKITSVNAGVSFAIASGATRLLLQSLETTGLAEFAVLAFGTSSVNAIDNLNIVTNASTTGAIVKSGDSTAGGVAPDLLIGIPLNAQNGGYAALGNGTASTDQIVMVTQGV